MRFMRSIVPVISDFSLRRRVKERLKSRSDWPLSEQHDSEEGSAIVEFLGSGITLLIPVLYGILTIFSLQSSGDGSSCGERPGGAVCAGAAAGFVGWPGFGSAFGGACCR